MAAMPSSGSPFFSEISAMPCRSAFLIAALCALVSPGLREEETPTSTEETSGVLSGVKAKEFALRQVGDGISRRSI